MAARWLLQRQFDKTKDPNIAPPGRRWFQIYLPFFFFWALQHLVNVMFSSLRTKTSAIELLVHVLWNDKMAVEWTTLGPASTYFGNDVVVCRRRVGQNRSDSRQSLLAADMSSLQGYVDRRVFLVLQDGRAIVVRVKSFFVESPDWWRNI